jgi:hypothetical protein
MAWRAAGTIAVLAAGLAACGGRAQNQAEGSAARGTDSESAFGGSANSADADTSSANGAAPAGGGPSGVAGDGAGNTSGSAPAPAAAAHSARACSNPTPHAQGGGYVDCADGSLRRPSAGVCQSSLPRAAPDLPLVFSECTTDRDCSSVAHGFCAYGACKSGCISDDECANGEACFCGAAIGVCVPAQCRSDADCPVGFPCSGYVRPGFAVSDLACQTPEDECLTDPQCYSPNPRVTCRFEVDHRVCYADPVG